jgi:hypothetical protein
MRDHPASRTKLRVILPEEPIERFGLSFCGGVPGYADEHIAGSSPVPGRTIIDKVDICHSAPWYESRTLLSITRSSSWMEHFAEKIVSKY